MRMRKKKNSQIRIEKCASLLINEPASETFSDVYAPFPEELRGLPVCVEFGCGKGDFVCGMAKKHPDRLFYAVERVSDVMLFALEKRAAQMAEDPTLPDNVRFIIGNAQNAEEWFAHDSLSAIYLNFSDPWPKKGYYKRRLTYRGFLEIYSRILARGGTLNQKTDNVILFDFTLEELPESPFKLSWHTRDLHASEWNEGNVVTEYERRFTELGTPINALSAVNEK